jgi:hypothetical protein
VCTKVEHGGKCACSVRYVPAGVIEDFVVRCIRAVTAQPEIVGQVLATMVAATLLPTATQPSAEKGHRDQKVKTAGRGPVTFLN